jgi:glycosyltransferase involved in cell wall biosynthesis
MFGGIGSVCYDLAYSLSKRQILTSVICGRSQTNTVSVEHPNKYLEIIRLPLLNYPPRFFWFQFQNIGFFKKMLSEKANVHIVNPQAGGLTALIKNNHKTHLITSVHGVPVIESKVFFNSPTRFWTAGDLAYNLFEYPLNSFLDELCLRKSDHIAVCSNTTLKEMSLVYGTKIGQKALVIYNGVNFEKLEAINPSSSDFSESLPTIVYYGRLYWRKGVYQFLCAMRQLKSSFPDIRVKIFGQGPMAKRMKQLIVEWNMSEIVEIRGHVSYYELINQIKASDIVVLPSLYEAQSVAVLEAMACKKPVVAFDYPFSREIIKDMQTGLLAKPCDTMDLCRKIELLLNDAGLRKKIGSNGYTFVKKEHDWTVLVERYIQLYET